MATTPEGGGTPASFSWSDTCTSDTSDRCASPASVGLHSPDSTSRSPESTSDSASSAVNDWAHFLANVGSPETLSPDDASGEPTFEPERAARCMGLGAHEISNLCQQYEDARTYAHRAPFPARPAQLMPQHIGAVFVESAGFSRKRAVGKSKIDVWKPSGGKMGSTVLRGDSQRFRRKYGKILHAECPSRTLFVSCSVRRSLLLPTGPSRATLSLR